MSIIKLKSKDGDVFEVDSKVAVCSTMIKTMLNDLGMDDDDSQEPIPLWSVSTPTLQKVIEWATHHMDDPAPVPGEMQIIGWDAEFLKVDNQVLFDLTRAANYLDIRGLLKLTVTAVADLMWGKTPSEIRRVFNIRNDLVPLAPVPQPLPGFKEEE